MRYFAETLLSLLVLLTPAVGASAGQADMFGVGGAAMGRGNGGVGLSNEAASLFYNPAGLALTPFDSFSLGGQLAFPDFDGVEGVEWADGREGEVMEQALSPHGLYLALVKRIAPPVRFGLAYTHPGKGFFYFEQEDPYIPSMVRWRNRAHRMALYMGFSVEPFAGLMLGVSVEFTAHARLTVDYSWEGNVGADDDPVALANLRMAEFHIKPALRPIFGLLVDPGRLAGRPDIGLRFGATYRNPIFVALDPTELTMDLENPAVLDPVFTLVDKVRATAVLTLIDFYTPRQVSLGLALDRPRFAGYVDVTWNQYSKMIPNAGVIAEGREGEGGMEVHWNFPDDRVASYDLVDGRQLAPDAFRDTWTVRGGVEIRLVKGGAAFSAMGGAPTVGRQAGVTIRAGASYDPALVGPQSGPTNLIDSPVVSGTAGVGLYGPDPAGRLAGMGSIDLAVQVHGALPASYDKDPSAVPEGVAMPVTWGQTVEWGGGVMVVAALTGTLRF
ncbi:MAG: hypothetical protein QGH45_18215 [Myxococcota bacterium]|nr:hypothetical protein [Myxococcota bacterium]